MLADVQLFGKEDGLKAEKLNMGLGEPEPIKYDIKLAGFGAAARLDSQGCAVQPSPYRCVLAALKCCIPGGILSLLIWPSSVEGALHADCLLCNQRTG